MPSKSRALAEVSCVVGLFGALPVRLSVESSGLPCGDRVRCVRLVLGEGVDDMYVSYLPGLILWVRCGGSFRLWLKRRI